MPSRNRSDAVGLRELSEWLDCTQRRVIQLVDEGVLTKYARGEYPLKENVAQYMAHLRRMAEGVGRKSELDHEKLLTARIERKRRQLEYDLQEGSLVTVEDHKRAMSEAFDLVRSNIRNLPGSLAPRLVGFDDARDIQAVLVREVDDALRSIVAQAEERARDPDSLPENLPGKAALEKYGIKGLVDLLEVEDFTIIPGVGKATARKLREWLGTRE